MSARDGNGATGGGRGGEDPEILAALAALEGRGLYAGHRLDDDLVDRYEIAAGALFAGLQRGVTTGPPAGFQDRLENLLLGELDGGGARRHRGVASPPPVAPPSFTARAPRDPGAADVESAVGGDSADRGPARPWGLLAAAAAGWLAAAGLLAALVTGRGADDGPSTPAERTVEQRIAALAAAGASVSPWTTEGLLGEVVWSDASNEGYMRIDGLEPNDPTRSQYQLWIFRGTDPAGEPHPIDGGVFDVRSDGQVIVPIDAKLDVGRAGLFAVTVERPGGVVVSGREQIVAVAVRS